MMAVICKPRDLLSKMMYSIRTLNSLKRSFSNSNCSCESNSSNNEKVEALPKMTVDGEYDIAIVGGGMVGLALACGLSSMKLAKDLSVAIIDSNPALMSNAHIKKDEVPHPRVSTVTPATISFFKGVGAWEYIEQQRHAYFNQMQVWDYSGLGYTRYHARDVSKQYLGCVVENKVLCDSLLWCLQQNLKFRKTICNAKLTSMEFPSKFTPKITSEEQERSMAKTSESMRYGSSVKLCLSNGKNLSAKLVVGADGANSLVREMAGLETTGWDYSQDALICTVSHSVESHCAWQRFLPSGPIALLPIGDKFSNIVWTMSPEESFSLRSASGDDFVKAVNHALQHGYGSLPQPHFLDELLLRISSVSGHSAASTEEPFQPPPEVTALVSERMSFPLCLRHAREYASERVVLIGDAAHSVHPLAGQGVNLGFGDAAALSAVIEEGLLVGADIGQLALLRKYDKERRVANLAMMAILDGFQKAYSVDLGLLNLVRAALFHGAQFVAPLKKSIISYAMGDQKWPFFPQL